LLALLDDIPVMLIAFDNARISPRPSKWDIHRVLVISSILAILSIAESLGLLRLLHHRLDEPIKEIQTAMFMQLVIAGHLLLFSTRSRGFFWQKPLPEWKFFVAIMGTQLLAAVMATQGWLITPIPWARVGFIWIYNLIWLILLDLVKVGLYKWFDKREVRQTSWQGWLKKELSPFAGRHKV